MHMVSPSQTNITLHHKTQQPLSVTPKQEYLQCAICCPSIVNQLSRTIKINDYWALCMHTDWARSYTTEYEPANYFSNKCKIIQYYVTQKTWNMYSIIQKESLATLQRTKIGPITYYQLLISFLCTCNSFSWTSKAVLQPSIYCQCLYIHITFQTLLDIASVRFTGILLHTDFFAKLRTAKPHITSSTCCTSVPKPSTLRSVVEFVTSAVYDHGYTDKSSVTLGTYRITMRGTEWHSFIYLTFKDPKQV
jgi:hypothetical protein